MQTKCTQLMFATITERISHYRVFSHSLKFHVELSDLILSLACDIQLSETAVQPPKILMTIPKE